jgi:ketosteroid isomerase-like protein
MKKKFSKNVQLIIDVLQDEVDGDVEAALKKITKDYTMTWVDSGVDGKELFPYSPRKGKNIKNELDEVYPIKGRQYDIKNIAEGDNVVMVELIESYPNPKTKKVFRTPLVLVLEMKEGKIRTGRHYLDPKLSYKYLTKAQVKRAYRNSKGSLMVIK